MASFKKGHKFSKETLLKMRLAKLGKKQSEEHRLAIGKANTGRIVPKEVREKISKSHLGVKLSEQHRERLSEAKKGRRLSAEHIKSLKKSYENRHPWNWKGGNKLRDIHSLFNPNYVLWRTTVFKRDNYKCKIGDDNCKGQLEAHHILPWRDFVELRYNINNGITLCHFHHPRARKEEKRLIPTFQELVTVS